MIKTTPYVTLISNSIKLIQYIYYDLNESEYNGHIHLFFRAIMNVMNTRL